MRDTPPITIELHLTYHCNLACPFCNRAGFAKTGWQPPDMTVGDVDRFLDDFHPVADRIGTIIVIGGEPTLNADCLAIVERLQKSRRWNAHLDIQVCSNGYSVETRRILVEIQSRQLATVRPEMWKQNGSKRNHIWKTIFVSPADCGLDVSVPCDWHSWGGCGISADSQGYTVCPDGGMIDSILGLGIRRRQLSDMFDRSVAQTQTDALCRHCGAYMDSILEPYLAGMQRYESTPMSPTWYNKLVKHE